MGKCTHSTVRLISMTGKMKLDMCEDLSSASYSECLSKNGEKSAQTSFLDNHNNDDIEIIKSQFCDSVAARESQDFVHSHSSSQLLFNKKDDEDEDIVNTGELCNANDKLQTKPQRSNSLKSEDNGYAVSFGIGSNHITSENESKSNDMKSGLLMSPISLTQDLPVSLETNNNRLSTVLENIQTSLVYIPKTRQLTTENNPENGENTKSNLCENGRRVNGLEDNDSSKSTSTETILNDVIDDDKSLDKWKLVNIHDSSSLGETDSLLRVYEPDQITCSSFELETSFPRVNTGDSLLRTFNDASSLSSLSTCTEFSVSALSVGDEGSEGTGLCIDTGDGGFMEVSLHSRNTYERCKNPSHDSGIEDKGEKPRRKGITGFLSRNLFSRKSKESDEENDQQGWKLFGRIPPKKLPSKAPQQISNEYQQRTAHRTVVKQKRQDVEVTSTTALILENRPMNLPSKDPNEAERHKQQYEAMVEAAKRKEMKEMKIKKKNMQQQLKQEDQMVSLSKQWMSEILPHWESMKNTKKTRDLWWLGLPTNVRGKVWAMAIGNDLNVTQELYEICVSRAEDRIKQACESGDTCGNSETSSEPPSNKESSVELIKLDISRTFPQLCIFQKGGPYHDLLHSLLGAYACYRPDVGYVQGMSFIAAVLLLNMDVAEAFICFANLLNRPCQVAFFRIDEEMMKFYFQTYEELFEENMPLLYYHFQGSNVTPDIYIIEWIFSLYSKSLPLDVACRIWDIFCRDGEEFLFRTALGILKLFEDILISLDFIHLAQFLTKLPENLQSDALFNAIECIKISKDKKRFAQLLANKKDAARDNT